MASRATAIAAALAAATTLAAPAAAGRAATGQRIAITSRNQGLGFVLVPLQRGSIARDSGSSSWTVDKQRFVIRDGQSIEVNEVSTTFLGKRGTFTARFHIEWTNAGHGIVVGSGRWTFVRGTGPYANLKGSGRCANNWPDGGFPLWRAEGVLRAGS